MKIKTVIRLLVLACLLVALCLASACSRNYDGDITNDDGAENERSARQRAEDDVDDIPPVAPEIDRVLPENDRVIPEGNENPINPFDGNVGDMDPYDGDLPGKKYPYGTEQDILPGNNAMP